MTLPRRPQRHKATECAIERHVLRRSADLRILQSNDQMLWLGGILLHCIRNILSIHTDLNAQDRTPIFLYDLRLKIMNLMQARSVCLRRSKRKDQQKKTANQKKSLKQKNHSYRQSHKSVKLRISISLLILP